ncbi:hypothetical protein [Aureispira anguillae]|uniref:Outer membrane lipoprotein-sorting protein n=1 Tax=Aureispira anguillae TaxID=2864201 RepID=A0A915YCD3_9BACT|nr:hypothetical protein [Aureispira anguillae]BDS10488.1 hypothetical protein AsAng_0011960 [Aureispira anguillae]
MNYIIYPLLWVSCLLFALPNAFAQEDLLALTKKVTQSIERDNATNLHIRYVQTSITANRSDVPQVVEVDLKQKGLVESMTSEHMDFFADSEKAYAVYKQAKKILVLKDVEKAKTEMKGASIQPILNKLWKTASISEQSPKGSKIRRFTIVPSEEMRELTKTVRLEIEFEAATLQMKRIVLRMVDQSPIKQIEFKYLILDKRANVKLFTTARSKIFDSNGKLLKKYEGFSVVEV